MRFGSPERQSFAGEHISASEAAHYLSRVLAAPSVVGPATPPVNGRDPLDRIFDAITHRRFCALSRSGTRPYRSEFLDALQPRRSEGRPLEFWFDIGPGYHASLRPGTQPLTFRVGLGELLMLGQIAAFLACVASIYPAGAVFRLVVDNLCALWTNDVPVALTSEYCSSLRRLIEDLGLAAQVSVFAESEAFSADEYGSLQRMVQAPPPVDQVSPGEIDNVARFLGRRCDEEEARKRIQRYHRATAVTEHLVGGAVRGVRLTQRATRGTLGFRSFPGGDARIQCGEVALGRNSGGAIVPILLTSRNIDFYACTRLRGIPDVPSAVADIAIASRRA